MDEEKEWEDINTDWEHNIAIGCDYIPWGILLVIMIVMLKIVMSKIS